MQWTNSSIDGSPYHDDEVLIAVNGVYHIAIYDEKNKVYKAKRNKKLIFKASEGTIYWTRINTPT